MGDFHIGPIFVALMVVALASFALVIRLLVRGIRYLATGMSGHERSVGRGPGAPEAGGWSLGAMRRRAAWARWVGVVAGFVLWIGYSAHGGGDAMLLGPSVVAVGYVAGVLIGEGLMPGPVAAVVRNSGLRARRRSDYVGRGAWWALGVVVAGGLATAAVAAALGGADGRSRVFDCSAATADLDPSRLPAWIQQSWSGSGWFGARSGSATLSAGRWHLHQIADWPGLVVVLPLLAAWTAGLALAWVTLGRVVARPRFSQEPAALALDDRVRTESARRVVGACGALVLVPSGLVLRAMGATLLNACNPAHADFPGRYLLDGANVLVALALVAAIGYPATVRPARGCADGVESAAGPGDGKALVS